MSTPSLPRFCPDCGRSFDLHVGLCGHRLLLAVALQSARVGVEVRCQHCFSLFVLSRTEPLLPPRKPRPTPRPTAGRQPGLQNQPEEDVA